MRHMTFAERLAHHRALYRAGAHFARRAIAERTGRLAGPVGCAPGAGLAYWLGAYHATRNCITMRAQRPRMSPKERAPTLDELRALLPVVGGKRRGLYAAAPGTGPAGKTCHDCDELIYMRSPAKHPKCGLTKYTHGDATTIRTSTPACKHFTERDDD